MKKNKTEFLEIKLKSNWSGVVGEIIGLFIGYWVLTSIPGWNIYFINNDFLLWAPIAKMAITVTGISRMFAYIFTNMRLSNLALVVAAISSAISMYYLVVIFPFDLSPVLNWMLKLVISFFVVSIGLSGVVRLFKVGDN
jgi:hypothetical protein